MSPYASIVEAAQRRYSFVPSMLVKYPLRTDAIISDVKSPILFARGTGAGPGTATGGRTVPSLPSRHRPPSMHRGARVPHAPA